MYMMENVIASSTITFYFNAFWKIIDRKNMIKKRLSLFSLCLLANLGMAYAQMEVTGTVVSQEDGEPVIGASVIVSGASAAQGTVTDVDGHFKLNVPNGTKLVFSYVGMKSQTMSASAQMMVSMVPNLQLQEVVVTGLQKTDRRLFTGATDRVNAADAKLDGVADISRSLEGRAAGVSVQNVSGTFGSAPKIRVRGATSIYGSSKPLWVVDGVIMEDVADVSADDLASGDPETLISSAIAGLNADDIESFQILKDGSATSIYGARAMAGVIVVTTKKGKAGQAHVNYTGELTTRLIPSYGDFDILNSQDQMSIYKEMKEKGWLNLSEILNGSDYGVYGKMYELINTFDPATGVYWLANTQEAQNAYLRSAEYRDTDWFQELFSSAIMQNHSVSLSGGTEKSSYYTSLSAMMDPGWYIDSKVNRYTFNANVSHHITDNISVNLIGSAAYRKQKAPGSLGQDVDVVSGQVKRDFDINPYSYALNTSRVLDPDTYYHANYASFNIKNELANNYIDLNVVDTKFQLEMKWKPIKDVELSALGALKYSSSSQEHMIKESSNQALAYRAMDNALIRDNNKFLYTDKDDPYALPISILPNGGIYQRTENSMVDYDFRVTANYNHTFANQHIVNLFGGMESTDIHRNRSSYYGWGMNYRGETSFFEYQYFKKLQEGNETYYTLRNTDSRSVAFYTNATYSYRGKYVLNGTFRYEGSNQMGRSTTARWMPTWNVSGAWNVHEENFFASLAPLSHLTFRLSYSLTGTPPDPSYTNSTAIIGMYTPYHIFSTEKELGFYLSSAANEELTCEKKHEFNVGVEAGLFHDRLNVTFDVYRRNNFDEIAPVVTRTQGIKYANVGSMKSWGEELSLSSTNIKSKNFSWRTSLIYSHNRTEITELFNQGRVIDLVQGTGFAKQGYPARALFSIPFVRIDENGYPVCLNEKGEETVGDINFQERNLTDYLKYEGSTDPIYNGSLGNVFSYKGFHLNVFMTYAFGSKVRLSPTFSARYTDLTSMTHEFKDRWVKAGDEKWTNVPGIVSNLEYQNNKTALITAYNAYNYSTARIAKGDFIRMKEISLAYDCPHHWFDGTPLNSLAVKLQATNLFLIYADKKLNGQDPEFMNAGGVASPMPRQFTLTLKLGF